MNLRIKRELGQNLTHTAVISSIIAKNNISSIFFDGKDVCWGVAGGCATPYLTNTNKSTSTPVKNGGKFENDVDFTEQSLGLYFSTKKLYRNNKKGLQQIHSIGFQRFKKINSDNVVLYTNCNPIGNQRVGWNDSHKESNTNKAKFASKNRAYERAMANVELWEYFVTFTFNPKKIDRTDYEKCKESLTRFLRRRNIKYFMVPETHKDKKAVHFHALVDSNISPYLKEFEGKALKNPYISGKLKKGEEIFHCSDYTQRFGYNIVEPCRSKEKCVNYMTKYILKTFDDEDFVRLGRRRFLISTGLKSPEIVMPRSIDFDEFEPVGFGRYCPKVYLKRIEVPEYAFVDSSPPFADSPLFSSSDSTG